MSLSIPVELPLDEDGYLRRQCPRCERVCKWRSEPAGHLPPYEPDPAGYFCPYCGEPSSLDQWWTNEQVEYFQALAGNDALRMAQAAMEAAAETSNTAKGLVGMKFEDHEVAPPAALSEPNDMLAVASPCHPLAPIKVYEDWSAALYCIIDAEPFTLPRDH